MEITIYGLFDANGQCRYVGQTRHPKTRSQTHKRKYPHLTFKALETCSWQDRTHVERIVTEHLKESGQCDLNPSWQDVGKRAWATRQRNLAAGLTTDGQAERWRKYHEAKRLSFTQPD